VGQCSGWKFEQFSFDRERNGIACFITGEAILFCTKRKDSPHSKGSGARMKRSLDVSPARSEFRVLKAKTDVGKGLKGPQVFSARGWTLGGLARLTGDPCEGLVGRWTLGRPRWLVSRRRQIKGKHSVWATGGVVIAENFMPNAI